MIDVCPTQTRNTFITQKSISHAPSSHANNKNITHIYTQDRKGYDKQDKYIKNKQHVEINKIMYNKENQSHQYEQDIQK